MTTSAAAMIISPMSVMVIPTIIPVMWFFINYAMAIPVVSILVPHEQRLAAIAVTRLFVIHNTCWRDISVVIANDVIHIRYIVRHIIIVIIPIAGIFIDDHPIAIWLKTGLAIGFLRSVADINCPCIFAAVITRLRFRRLPNKNARYQSDTHRHFLKVF